MAPAGAGVEGAALAAVTAFVCLWACWLPPTFTEFTKGKLITWAEAEVPSRGVAERADDGVTFRTETWTLPRGLVLKAYPDVVIYYVFLLFLVTLGTLSHMFPRSLGAA